MPKKCPNKSRTAVQRVEQAVAAAVDSPDAPLEWTGLNLPDSVLENVTPSKMYMDGGVKLKVASDICNRGMSVPFPTTPAAVRDYYNGFVDYCWQWRMPPTLSLFAMWCGTTVNGYNRYMRQAADSDLGRALEECKESLRAFLEVSAMSGEVDKLVYFHQQKGYYDVVEKVEIKHDVDVRGVEMTEAEIEAVISSLPPVEYEEVDDGEAQVLE